MRQYYKEAELYGRVQELQYGFNQLRKENEQLKNQLILKTKNEATDIINDGARITKVLGDKKYNKQRRK